MSSGDEWEDPYRDDYRDERDDDRGEWGDESVFEERERPKSTGMSTGMKVLIVVLCVFGGGALVCCGVGAYFISKFAPSISQDPEVVEQTTREIVDIDIPDEFQPMHSMSMNMFAVTIKSVQYQRGDGIGMLTLMEMGGEFQQGGPGQAQQMRDILREQNQDLPNLDADDGEPEVREFTIRGEPVDVQFVKATDPETGNSVRQISAVFPGKQGTVMLMLIVDGDAYDEAEVEALLESIR